MAKALFHKSQRVYVKPVGTWAMIERVVPHWVKDIPEPLKISYDCGLGREFQASELISEKTMNNRDQMEEEDIALEKWRIQRMHNRAGAATNDSHPYPGTYPAVLTDEQDWGGWRVPGAEYDRDPQRIEHQARMIVNAPDLIRIARKLTEVADDQAERFPKELAAAAKRCTSILQYVYELEGDLPEMEAAANDAA